MPRAVTANGGVNGHVATPRSAAPNGIASLVRPTLAVSHLPRDVAVMGDPAEQSQDGSRASEPRCSTASTRNCAEMESRGQGRIGCRLVQRAFKCRNGSTGSATPTARHNGLQPSVTAHSTSRLGGQELRTSRLCRSKQAMRGRGRARGPIPELGIPDPGEHLRHGCGTDVLSRGRPRVDRAEDALIPGIGIPDRQHDRRVRPQPRELAPLPASGPVDRQSVNSERQSTGSPRACPFQTGGDLRVRPHLLHLQARTRTQPIQRRRQRGRPRAPPGPLRSPSPEHSRPTNAPPEAPATTTRSGLDEATNCRPHSHGADRLQEPR
jgi:hypothetical protein